MPNPPSESPRGGFFSRLFGGDRSHALRLEPSGLAFEASSKTTVLQAALEQGIPYPHRCRVGSCGTCKSKLLEGQVKELTDKGYILTPDELQQGYILACQSQPRSNLRLEVARLGDPAQQHPVVHTQGKVAALHRLTHDIIGLEVSLASPMAFTSGQYAGVGLPGRLPQRCYSFAQASGRTPTRELYFHIRRVPQGAFTSWLAESSQVGDILEISGPYGDFWLRPSPAPILCVAGGSGMAPVKSILEQARQDRVVREVVYFFGARTQEDLYCLEELEGMARQWPAPFRFVPVLSEEPAGSTWKGARGLVTDHLDGLGPKLATFHAYLSGPPAMIDAAIAKVQAAGILEEHIHFDRFEDRRPKPRA